MKGAADLATMTGWHTEAFQRTKRMKPLADYLRPVMSPEDRRTAGAREVSRMFDALIAKQGNEDGIR